MNKTERIQESTWHELLQDFERGLEKAIDELEKRDVENIPGAKAVSYTHLTLPTILLV